MAEQFDSLNAKHTEFIADQQLFFVSTAATEGRINLSPKGMDSFRVIDSGMVHWLNLTGSGNETAAHLLENPRMTIMFCSFTKQPMIMRLYGNATAIHPRDAGWSTALDNFPDHAGARQIFALSIDMVQTSCGYAVPHYEYQSERPTLDKWARNKGRAGIEEYWSEKNQLTIDGKPTKILE